MNEARSWTVTELQLLRDNAVHGAHFVAILTGRSVHSVQQAAKRHRISLRRKGERRGSVLNERRPGDDPARLRILDGAGDARKVANYLTLEAAARRGAQPDLCPSCAARPVERPRTGLCQPCHLMALADAHRHDQARAEAQRELWTERQRKHRGEDIEGARWTSTDDEGRQS